VPSESEIGNFVLSNGILSFSWLHFEVPGAQVHLVGKYSLDGNEFDFHAKARRQAKLSHMVTGWKSVLLKPVDPFFSKNGAGADLPVKITGTRAEQSPTSVWILATNRRKRGRKRTQRGRTPASFGNLRGNWH